MMKSLLQNLKRNVQAIVRNVHLVTSLEKTVMNLGIVMIAICGTNV